MSNAIAALILERRKAMGLTQEELGNKCGVSRAAVNLWEKGKGHPDKRRASSVAEILGVDAALLRPDADEGTPTYSKMLFGGLPRRGDDPLRMVPVHGTVESEKPKGIFDFQFTGEIVDHALLPARLALQRGVGSFYMQSDRMEPRYYKGERVYYGIAKPPSPHDHVVIVGKTDDPIKPVAVGRLLSQSRHGVEVEQYNPRKTVTVRRTDIGGLWRVFTPEELAGAAV